jgi:UDP-arabinose 4-epimerase
VGESVENPRKYFRNNVQAALALLNTAIDAGVRSFVFSSSCAVYGAPPKVPIGEDTPRQPVNPYGVSKLFLENALEAYQRAYGLRFTSLRYFNAAGADESGEIGELHDPETHLIPLALAAAAGTGPELQVLGFDYPTPDRTCIRDYVHVNDLAEAHVLALQHLVNGGAPLALNLGTGEGYSVKQVLAAIQEATGMPVPWRMGPRRPGDPPVLVGRSVPRTEFAPLEASVLSARYCVYGVELDENSSFKSLGSWTRWKRWHQATMFTPC